MIILLIANIVVNISYLYGTFITVWFFLVLFRYFDTVLLGTVDTYISTGRFIVVKKLLVVFGTFRICVDGTSYTYAIEKKLNLDSFEQEA